MNEVAQLISALGFPIIAALGCAYFVKWQYEQNQKQVEQMRKEHKEEVANMTKAIENNTIAITRLVEKFDKE
jgi:uncharacterized protein HemX